jgi:hypothetical protein
MIRRSPYSGLQVKYSFAALSFSAILLIRNTGVPEDGTAAAMSDVNGCQCMQHKGVVWWTLRKERC